MAIEFNTPKPQPAGNSQKEEFDGLDLNELGDEDETHEQEIMDLVEDEDDFDDDAADEDDDELDFDDEDDDDDDSLFDDDEDDPAPKKKKKPKSSDNLTNRALLKLLEDKQQQQQPQPKQQEETPDEDDYEDWSKGILEGSAINIPEQYLTAIRSGDPTQASKAMNALLGHQGSKILEGVNKRIENVIEKRLKAAQEGQQAAMQQQQQAAQVQQQVENDFKTRYPEFSSLSAHEEFGQYLNLAVQTVSARPETKTFTEVKQFTTAVAKETQKLLKPVFAAAGMRFTKKNLEKLAKKQKRSLSKPPAPIGGKNSSKRRNQQGTPDGEMFDISEL